MEVKITWEEDAIFKVKSLSFTEDFWKENLTDTFELKHNDSSGLGKTNLTSNL